MYNTLKMDYVENQVSPGKETATRRLLNLLLTFEVSCSVDKTCGLYLLSFVYQMTLRSEEEFAVVIIFPSR